MVFVSKEDMCTYDILRILNKGKSRYTNLFKETQVSHTTLQRAINTLLEKKCIIRKDIGHMKVDYLITTKGKKLLELLTEIKRL